MDARCSAIRCNSKIYWKASTLLCSSQLADKLALELSPEQAPELAEVTAAIPAKFTFKSIRRRAVVHPSCNPLRTRRLILFCLPRELRRTSLDSKSTKMTNIQRK